MDRRIALKNLALILGSTIAMPGILKADERFQYNLRNLSLTPDQQQLVADIAETIIPETDTPGAKTLGLPAFVLKMLDECTPKATQDGFVAGAKAFPAFAEANIKKGFASATPDERTALLMKLEQNEGNLPPDVLGFYRDIKKYTVFGYTNSKFFMTKQIVYQLVPGKYNPAYKITPAQHG